MLFKRFDVSHTHVQIDEDVIPRPAYIGASQWVEFWENAYSEASYDAGYEDATEKYREEISELEDENKELQSDLEKYEKEVADLERQVNEIEDEAYERGHRDGIVAGRLDSSL